jgi:prepilin-type N-terminal cleavage/methylation domain-containing protein
MPKNSNTGFTLVEIMVVVAVIAAILAVAIPNFLGSSEKSRKTICIANLTKMDTAIDQWVLQENISHGIAISESAAEEICNNNIKGGRPKCPSGGVYAFYIVGVEPQVTCSLEEKGHKLP